MPAGRISGGLGRIRLLSTVSNAPLCTGGGIGSAGGELRVLSQLRGKTFDWANLDEPSTGPYLGYRRHPPSFGRGSNFELHAGRFFGSIELFTVPLATALSSQIRKPVFVLPTEYNHGLHGR